MPSRRLAMQSTLNHDLNRSPGRRCTLGSSRALACARHHLVNLIYSKPRVESVIRP